METARLFVGTVGGDRREMRPFLLMKMDSPSPVSDPRSCVSSAVSTPIGDWLRTKLYAKSGQLDLNFRGSPY